MLDSSRYVDFLIDIIFRVSVLCFRTTAPLMAFSLSSR